jgi:hypothetical protein
MHERAINKLTLDNPYALPLLFAGGGALGFVVFEWVLDGTCFDEMFASTFIIATLLIVAMLVHWGLMLEKINFKIKKLPSVFLISLAIINLYVVFHAIQYGPIEEQDLRLESVGSSVLIMLSGAISLLFFPIGYFAAQTQFLKRIILGIFGMSAVIGLLTAPSKSVVFSLAFTILLFIFLKRKQTGEQFPYSLIGKFTLVMLTVLLILQIVLASTFYGKAPLEFMLTLLNRAMQNFDGAIYGCMVENYAQAPNSFFTYTFLPVLKRIDPSYYDLDYFNVPQWLLFEVLGISRDGRFGYPNDNLYTALYFGGFRYFSFPFFLMLVSSVHFFIKKCVSRWQQTNTASPIELAVVLSIPLMFSSIQEFVGLLLFYLIFKIYQVLITGFNHLMLFCVRQREPRSYD